MAWDLGITFFHDKSGDDTYKTSGMTLGSAAQNSISIFVDSSGDDLYFSNDFPSSIPTNKARGGISLGYFFDLGGNDTYEKAKNNSSGINSATGFWFDTIKSIGEL